MCSRIRDTVFTVFDLRFTRGDFSGHNWINHSNTTMNREEMKKRTKAYANRIVKLSSALSANWIAQTLGKPLLRSGTSVGANYRAVRRAKSNSDFINKLRIVEEECDESLFWMELLVENGLVKPARLSALMKEGNEILAIIVSSAKTARFSKSASIANRKS